MNVRELIQELAKEEDMDSTVYVRFMDDDGDIRFVDVDGIALPGDSHKLTNMITCTTLILGA